MGKWNLCSYSFVTHVYSRLTHPFEYTRHARFTSSQAKNTRLVSRDSNALFTNSVHSRPQELRPAITVFLHSSLCELCSLLVCQRLVVRESPDSYHFEPNLYAIQNYLTNDEFG